ncbi:MAG: ankyrin repeat domain-containing protein, partial [Gammaproteobacteria bacterium]|nr:ankyrin repeat domain-containing protein [Gammaproteobacteria bacterium]
MHNISIKYIRAPDLLYKDHIHAFKLKWWLSGQGIKNEISKEIMKAIVANDDHETFSFLIKHGFDINMKDEEDNNILMLALSYHSTKLISTILSFLKNDLCLDLDVINHKGHQALSIAILKDHDIEVIKGLLTLGANPNHHLYNNSIHPALAAIMSNHMPLLDALVSSQQFNFDQQLSQTLFSLIEQQPKVVGYYATLISRYHWLKDRVSNPYTRWVIYDEDKPKMASGSGINEKDAFGLTALHYAIILNKPNAIKYLTSHPAFNACMSEDNAKLGLLEIMFSSGHWSLFKDIVDLKDIELPSDMYRTDYVKLLLNIGGQKRFQHLASLFEGHALYSRSHIDIAFSHERFKVYFLKHMDEFTGNSFVS